MKLGYKLLLYFIAISIFSAYCNIYIASFVLKGLQDERLKTSEVVFAKSFAKRINKYVSEVNATEIEDILFSEESLAAEKIEYIIVFKKSGELIADTFVAALPSQLKTLKNTFKKDEKYRITKTKAEEFYVYDIAVPINYNASHIGTLHIGIRENYINNIITPTKKISQYMMYVSMFTLILGIIAFSWLSSSLVDSLHKLQLLADKVSQGELEINIDIASKDEIGNLAESFNSMIQNLRSLLKKIISTVQHLTVTSNELSVSNQEQASGIQEQSSSIAETTSAAKELSKSAEMVGENINKVIGSTDHALKGMTLIKDSIGATAEKITSLNEKSQKIGKITHLIDAVADKTNLLAINAAIEAARAGEQGKGFTVVADEIRKLSDSTAKSTKEITALIAVIQNEISNSIISMEQSVNNVNEEMELSFESSKRAKEIAMSATQQIGGSRQIADAMAGIDLSMKQVSTAASQSEEAAKQLKVLANELTHIASNFKISS